MSIRIESISKRAGKKEILRDISLEIRKGSFFCVLGMNGAGKTTLLSIISGMMHKTSGEISYGEDCKPCATSVGFSPADASLPDMKLKHLLRYISILRDTGYEEQDLVKLIGPGCMDTKAQHLSSGQKKMVSVFLAFIGSPDLVILDEPFSGLDSIHIRWLRSFIAERIKGKTVIASTNQPAEMESLCTGFCIIHKGRVIKAKPSRKKSGPGKIITVELNMNDERFISLLKKHRDADLIGHEGRFLRLKLKRSPYSWLYSFAAKHRKKILSVEHEEELKTAFFRQLDNEERMRPH